MSNNENRNSLTLQQQLELLALSPSGNDTYAIKAVMHAIELNFSYDRIMVLLNLFKLLKSTYECKSLVEASEDYELPEELLEKLIKNNFCGYSIQEICKHLKSGDISITDVNALSNYQLSKSDCYDSSSWKQVETIFLLLKNGFSVSSIIEDFKPNFGIDEMLYGLLNHKLDILYKDNKISKSDSKSINLGYRNRTDRLESIFRLESILSAIDNDFSWNSIVSISKCSNICSYHVNRMFELKLSEKEISLVSSGNSFEEINLILDSFEKTALNYDQVLYLKEKKISNKNFEEIIKFFSSSSSEE